MINSICLFTCRGCPPHCDTHIYSTSAQMEDINEARKPGALCYFKKPSDFKGFIEPLEVIINHVNGAGLQPSNLIFL